ncbi:anthrone oxygenase family protein [Hydrogenophaga laconesensis]|uniref:Membrane protein n=1 Tax=Hydrogenophaga laconesensis TaxID=1805971 RepID=A0ABU1VDZ1_9BURK|nr:anthrone oxygenase family protein [Hydrogenophaga laconesensis]MDR7095398.1 putative membrane protein [Hydrogenophaga laconesensis]
MSAADLLVLASSIGSATVGGVFFAFSSFVMKALAQLPPAQGVAAMQRINVVVINPWFLGVFVGTLLLSIACVVMSLMAWQPMLLAAGLLYAVGTFAVTGALNVPRNERLARIDAASPEAAAYWPVYVREWTFWNHVRTVAALASAVCAVLVWYK